MARKGKKNFPVDLRTLVNLHAWEDPKFAAELQRNPNRAIQAYGKTLGLKLPKVKFKVVEEAAGTYTVVLSKNPVGMSPQELRASRKAATGEGGAITSITADCACGRTETGGCACATLFGTPCLGCRTWIVCP